MTLRLFAILLVVHALVAQPAAWALGPRAVESPAGVVCCALECCCDAGCGCSVERAPEPVDSGPEPYVPGRSGDELSRLLAPALRLIVVLPRSWEGRTPARAVAAAPGFLGDSAQAAICVRTV